METSYANHPNLSVCLSRLLCLTLPPSGLTKHASLLDPTRSYPSVITADISFALVPYATFIYIILSLSYFN